MRRLSLLLLSLLPGASPAQEPEECIGHDLKDPEQSLQLLSPTHTWTFYNLGPGRVTIHASSGDTLPGPTPNSDPTPSEFRGEVGISYRLSLDGAGLTIIYVCPGL